MGGDTPPSPLRVQTAPSVTGRPRFPRLTVGVHAEQAPAAAFPGGGAARTATSVPAISRLPPRWPCAHVCPPPQPGGSLGRDGEAALLSPRRAQGQTQGQDGLALLLVVTATATRARACACRPHPCPGSGTQHPLRSARRPGPNRRFSPHAFILMPPSDHTTHLCCLLQEFTSVGHNWLAMGVGGSVSLSFMPTYCIQQSFNTRLGSRRRPQAVPKYLNV